MWPAPTPEKQSSIDDNWDCSGYATSHAIESQIEVLTGKRVNLSPRFLAIIAGTVPGVGNYLSKQFATIEKYGIPLAEDCPEPKEPWTNEEYYTFPITPELLAKAKKFLDDWSIDYILSKPASEMLPKLKTAPLIAFIPQGSPNHFVEVLDANTRFDSYVPFVAPLGPVQNYSQFIIKSKNMVTKYKVHNQDGRLGIMLDYGFEAVVHYAKDMDMYNHLLKDYEVPADAVTKEL